MKIGIDIDGVLNSSHDFCIDYGTKFCSLIHTYHLENADSMDTTDMFLWDEDTAHQFWNHYRYDLVCVLPAKKYAAEVIRKLKKEGAEIYIITARHNGDSWYPDNLQDVEMVTKKWLEENEICYDKIFFNTKDKGACCLENGVDIMIEDEVNNIKKLMGNTDVFVYDCPYNRISEFSSLTRVYSWYDIYDKIHRKKF